MNRDKNYLISLFSTREDVVKHCREIIAIATTTRIQNKYERIIKAVSDDIRLYKPIG